ncbi:arylsulfatase [Nocardioides solisilvae]|uniref:arylsulfatase n=1 Tax=Nocardioides solisilvae TaxID=1542435 RepID=UPI000D74C047|nr:arylsulfatase [Nocardioides solisilvae]
MTSAHQSRHQSRHQPRPAVEAPPNVLLVLLDDMGFGASSAFGGPCPMPAADQLAAEGLRYSRFHTTALCSPTRAALMTGRNHHAVGMGTVVEISSGTPGYDATRPPSAGTLAQALRGSGYATAAFGKWHQTPTWEQTPAGPFDRWPTREGFDRFYGFLGGEASQFEPTLVEGTTFVDPPRTAAEGYHLSEDLVDRAIDWIDDVRSHGGGKPWFTYLAFGATHAPFQLPEEWRGRHRGEFAHGWDRQRELTLERQKELGVVPPDAELAPWTPGVPHWDELDETQRLVAERLMETYAAFAEHTDAQVQRLVDALRAAGDLENTVVLYVLGDNGASAEGGLEGTLNETMRFNGVEDTAGRIAEQLDLVGGPDAYVHYPAGWAVAMDTPYQWTKQVASHYGGTRNGLIVHWPAGIADRGGVRDQWHHVVDVFPTILEVTGVPHPETVEGVAQDPVDGVSFAYSFNDADAPERHTTQYFEMLGNRGIYHEGWTAVAKHRSPWLLGAPATSLDDDTWELYDTTTDWTQARDLAARHPERLAELQELFHAEARRHGVVLPGGTADGVSRRPAPPRRLTLRAGAGRLREDAVPPFKNGSWSVTARIADAGPRAGKAEGVLVAQGSSFAGWSFYVRDGFLTFAYAWLGAEETIVRSQAPVGEGPHVVQARFAYDGGGAGRGGELTLLLDGREVGSGRIERTISTFFSMDQTLDVGIDRGTPVTDDYGTAPHGRRGFPWTGRIVDVTLVAGDDHEPLGGAEELKAALVAH